MTQEILPQTKYEAQHSSKHNQELQISLKDILYFLSKYGWILMVVTFVSCLASSYYAFTTIYSPFHSELVAFREENPSNKSLPENITRFKETIVDPTYSQIVFQNLVEINRTFGDKATNKGISQMDLFPLSSRGDYSDSAITFHESATNNNLMIHIDLPINGLGNSIGYDIINSVNKYVEVHNKDLLKSSEEFKSRTYIRAVRNFKKKENEFLKLKQSIDPALAKLNMAMSRVNFELFSKIKTHNKIIDKFLAFPGSIHIHDYFQKNKLSVEEYQSLSIHTIRILGALVESKGIEDPEANKFLSKYTEIRLKMSELESQHFKAEDDFNNAKVVYTNTLKKIQASSDMIEPLMLPKLALVESIYQNKLQSNNFETKDNSKQIRTVLAVTILGLLSTFILLLIIENYRLLSEKRAPKFHG